MSDTNPEEQVPVIADSAEVIEAAPRELTGLELVEVKPTKGITEEEEQGGHLSDLQTAMKALTPKFKNPFINELMQSAMPSRVMPDNYLDKHNLLVTALIEKLGTKSDSYLCCTREFTKPHLENIKDILDLLYKVSSNVARSLPQLNQYLLSQIFSLEYWTTEDKIKDNLDANIAGIRACSESILKYAEYCQNNAQLIIDFDAFALSQWLCSMDCELCQLLGLTENRMIEVKKGDSENECDVVAIISQVQDGLSIGYEGRHIMEILEIAGVAHEEELEKLSKELGM